MFLLQRLRVLVPLLTNLPRLPRSKRARAPHALHKASNRLAMSRDRFVFTNSERVASNQFDGLLLVGIYFVCSCCSLR